MFLFTTFWYYFRLNVNICIWCSITKQVLVSFRVPSWMPKGRHPSIIQIRNLVIRYSRDKLHSINIFSLSNEYVGEEISQFYPKVSDISRSCLGNFSRVILLYRRIFSWKNTRERFVKFRSSWTTMIPYEDIKTIYSIFSLKRPNNIVHTRSAIFVNKIWWTKRSRNVELITRRSSTRGNVQCRQIFRLQKILGNRGNDDPTRIRDRFTLGTNEKGKDSRSTRHNLLKHHRFRGTGARTHTHTHAHIHVTAKYIT